MKRILVHVFSTMVLLVFSVSAAYAEQGALTKFNSNYATNVTDCSLCHGGIPSLNSFGSDFLAQGGSKSLYNVSFGSLDVLDSDGNGTNNGIQIRTNALSPADANITLASLSAALAQDLASTTGCMTSSATTPLMMLLVMLSLGFFVRRKKD